MNIGMLVNPARYLLPGAQTKKLENTTHSVLVSPEVLAKYTPDFPPHLGSFYSGSYGFRKRLGNRERCVPPA